MIEVGENVPEFELHNQDDKPVRLSDFRGRKIVLFAFPKAATSGCTRQACAFQDRLALFEVAGAVVLGLSPDPPKALARWKMMEGLSYDLLSDPEHHLLEALGVWGEKSLYGRKYWGVIRSHFVIDEAGRLIDAQLKINPAQSATKALGVITR